MNRVFPLVVVAMLSACAADPAKDVAPAEVHEAVASPAPSPAPSPELPADAKTLSFTSGSSIEMVGSKVTGSHTIALPVSAGSVVVSGGGVFSTDVTFGMAELTSDQAKLTKHLKSDDFFNTERFPTARFVSSKVASGAEGAQFDVTGALTIRDVTHDVTIPAKLVVSEGGTQIIAEFSINRQNWGISYPGKPDNLIRDDVVVRFDLNAL